MNEEITKEEILSAFDILVADSDSYHNMSIDNSHSISPRFYEDAEKTHRKYMEHYAKIRDVLEQVLPMMVVIVKEEK